MESRTKERTKQRQIIVYRALGFAAGRENIKIRTGKGQGKVQEDRKVLSRRLFIKIMK